MLKRILQDEAYNNMPFFFEYLKKNGFSRQLIHKYVLSGWLEKIAQGVYQKPGIDFSPIAVIRALQKQLGIEIYLGAATALSVQNVSFNLRTERNIEVFIPLNYRPTRWLKSIKQIRWFKASLFKTTKGLHIYNDIFISTLERAILETISLVPVNMEYEEAYHLLELLPTLRKTLLQELLQECHSVKTKRLFLYMAETIAHNWFSGLDLTTINLGHGDRQIVKNGVYNKKYKIIIPEVT